MEYDPKTQFVKMRMGRACVFDKQIQLWRKRDKKKGALKASVNRNNPATRANTRIKNIFE